MGRISSTSLTHSHTYRKTHTIIHAHRVVVLEPMLGLHFAVSTAVSEPILDVHFDFSEEASE